jgi:pimeloyl-ACP methyl ester carboxylesterase
VEPLAGCSIDYHSFRGSSGSGLSKTGPYQALALVGHPALGGAGETRTRRRGDGETGTETGSSDVIQMSANHMSPYWSGVEVEMPLTQVGDIRLCYNVRGDGQPLVMITGFASAQSTLFALARVFARHYRVVTYDNRGIGGSDKPTGPYSIAMMANDTVGLMDYLEIDRAHLLGGSMGGMVAQHIAIDHPQRVDKLILSSTSADGRWLSDLAETTTPNWNRSWSDLTSADLRKLIVAIAMRSCNQPFNRLVFVTLAKLQARYGTLKGLAEQIGAMVTHNVLNRLPLIQVPTLVLAGSKDRLIAPQSSEVLASRITGAKLVIIDGGSHAVAGEMLVRFTKEVLGFLRSG